MTDGQRQLTIVCKVREGMKKIEEKNKEKNKIIIVTKNEDNSFEDIISIK